MGIRVAARAVAALHAVSAVRLTMAPLEGTGQIKDYTVTDASTLLIHPRSTAMPIAGETTLLLTDRS